MTDAKPSGAPAPPPRGIFLFLPAVLALITHVPVLAAPLFWDDFRMLERPRALHRPDFWREIFSLDYGMEFLGRPVGYYRPLFIFTSWILHQLFGPTAFIYHFVSLAGMVGLAAIAGLLFRRCFPDSPRLALVLACLCAVHPLNTDIVLFFASLPDLVVALAVGGMLLLVGDKRPPVAEALIAGALAFVAALFKESGFLAMGPICLVLLIARRFAAGGGVAVALAAAAALRLNADLAPVPPSAVFASILPSGSGHALQALMLHLWHFFVPIPRVGPRTLFLSGSLLTSILVLLIFKGPGAGVLLSLRRRQLEPALWWTWVFVALHGLMTAGGLGMPYSERYASVVPMVWVLGITLQAAERRLQPSPERLRTAAKIGAVWVALHGSAGMAGLWRGLSARTFWESVVRTEPQMPEAYLGLAGALRDEGDLVKAEAAAQRSAQLNTKPADRSESLLYLAQIQFYLDKNEAALATLAERDKVDPGQPDTSSLRAICLFTLGRRPEAVAAIRAAVAAAPESRAYQLQFLKIAVGAPGVPFEELVAVRNRLIAAGGTPPAEAIDEATMRRLHGS